MAQHRLVLDEAGVRHSLGNEHRYFPFEHIADVELRTRLLRDPVLVLLDTKSEEHVVFAGPDALEIHKALAEHARTRLRAPEHWPRHERPLEVWLESVRASNGYRTSGDLVAKALEVLADARASVEDRAGAAHVLVRFAEGDDLVAAAKLFLTRAFPPLVVAAAVLADGGFSLTKDDGWLYLSPADRKSVDLHRRHDAQRHLDAVAEARRQLRIEAPSLLPVPTHVRAAHHAPAAYRDMTKWIGKSWGI